MCLVVGYTLTVVDTTVDGGVDAEGQESHGGEATPSWVVRRAVASRQLPRGAYAQVQLRATLL